jgi:hypothetical protein
VKTMRNARINGWMAALLMILPHNLLDPARTWFANQEVIERHGLLAPEGISPRRRPVQRGLYRSRDGCRSTVDRTSDGDISPLASTEVVR